MTKEEQNIKIKEYLLEFLTLKDYCIDSTWLSHTYYIERNKKNKKITDYDLQSFIEQTSSKFSYDKEFFEFVNFIKTKDDSLLYTLMQNKVPTLDKYGNGADKVLLFYNSLKHNPGVLLKITEKTKIINNLIENDLVKPILDLLEKKDNKKIFLENVFGAKSFTANIDKQKVIYGYCKELNLIKEYEDKFILLKKHQNIEKESAIEFLDNTVHTTIIKINLSQLLANNLDNDLSKENYKQFFEGILTEVKKDKNLNIKYTNVNKNDLMEFIFIAENPDIKMLDVAFKLMNDDITEGKIRKSNSYSLNVGSVYYENILDKAKIKYYYDTIKKDSGEQERSELRVANKRNKI